MSTEVSHIRFICTKHNAPLKNCGSGRVFYPTYTFLSGVPPFPTVDPGWEGRTDEDGWLILDTSEMFCPECGAEVDRDPDYEIGQDWEIQAR